MSTGLTHSVFVIAIYIVDYIPADFTDLKGPCHFKMLLFSVWDFVFPDWDLEYSDMTLVNFTLSLRCIFVATAFERTCSC